LPADNPVFDRAILEGVLESSTDCIKILDLDGRVLFMNTIGLRLLQLDQLNDATGKHWTELWPIEHAATVREALAEAQAGQPYRFQAPRQTAKGVAKWWDVSVTPVIGRGSKVERILSVSRDITEQRRTDTELRESEERFRALISATTALVWRGAPDGAVVEGFGNSEYADDYLAHFQGRAWTDAVHPADRDEALARVEEAQRTGIPFETIHRVRRPSGEYRWAYCKGVALRGPDGSIREWVGTLTDIHDRYTAELALRQSEERYRLLAENTGDIIIRTGLDGRRLYVSSACRELLGWPPEHFQGTTVIEDLHPDDVPLVTAVYEDLFAGRKENETVAYRMRHKDGRWIWLEARRRLVRNDDGTPREVVSVVRDISERLRLEAQLRQSQKMEALGHLTGGIAHDFNNLLTVIVGSAEILVDGTGGDLRAAAEMVRDAAERGAELTQHLLAFGRRQSLKPERLNLEEIVGGMTSILQRTIGEHIELRTEFNAGRSAALVDRTLLQNALLNLVVNARDAMPKGGTITITTTEGAAHAGQGDLPIGQPIVTLTVADTGQGMSPDVVERAFEPFFTTKEVGKGSGLGLSMVYGFARQSGGHVAITSKPGEGTCVSLILRAAAPALPGATTKPIRPCVRAGQKERVLVVEDDHDVRAFVCAQLRRLDYEVCHVSDAWSAIQLVDDGEPFDLLFTDVVLPKGLSGVELASRVKERRPEMKIMLTSGYSEEVFQAHGRPDAPIQLLRKPYRIADLAEAVRNALQRA
jgi:PAS domain S-box-containing protein